MVATVIGVDGARAGWIAIIWDGAKIRHKLFSKGRFEEILAENAAIIAVDMPIGLPRLYGRAAEKEARRYLLSRSSSLFPVPARAAISAASWQEACALSLAHSEPPRKPSKQAFNIFPKMREIDVLMMPELQGRLHEIHPEVSFSVMNGHQPLKHSKKTKDGERERLKLLLRAGLPVPNLARLPYRAAEVGRNDIIDACAAAWSARRILQGKSITFPTAPQRDDRGLQMCIKA